MCGSVPVAALLHACGGVQTFYVLLQAVAAAVQTTHLLRLVTAVALVMVLRSAKSVMYSGKEVSGWQRALVHVYDLPPLVLLLLLQLSAIALPAKMYRDTPSTVPQKVHPNALGAVDWCTWIPKTASKSGDMLLLLHCVG